MQENSSWIQTRFYSKTVFIITPSSLDKTQDILLSHDSNNVPSYQISVYRQLNDILHNPTNYKMSLTKQALIEKLFLFPKKLQWYQSTGRFFKNSIKYLYIGPVF